MKPKQNKAVLWIALAIAALIGAAKLKDIVGLFSDASTKAEDVANSPPFVPPVGSSFRLDAEPIPLKIRNRYYAIPANVLDAPPEGGHEGAFLTDTGALLVFFWPTMEGRTKENWREEGGPVLGGERGIHVLTNTMREGLGPNQRLQALFNAYALEAPLGTQCQDPFVPEQCPALFKAGRFLQQQDLDGMVHFERTDRNSDYKTDIYIEHANGTMVAFFICNHPMAARKGKHCQLHFVHQDRWYKVGFNFTRVPLTERTNLRAAILSKLEEFEAAGNRLRDSLGDR